MWETKGRKKSRMTWATGVVGVPFTEGFSYGGKDLGGIRI